MIVEVRAEPPFYKNGFVVGCKRTREGVIIDPGDEVDGLLATLRQLPGVTEVRAPAPAAVDLYADRGGPLIPEIARLSDDARAEIRDVKISEPSLENLFLHHTGRSLRD
jgi:ABC-2 type transport system ATP-binding protein